MADETNQPSKPEGNKKSMSHLIMLFSTDYCQRAETMPNEHMNKIQGPLGKEIMGLNQISIHVFGSLEQKRI